MRQGWRFPSWRDSSGAWAPCILVHYFPTTVPWPLICCQMPLPWFPRQGKRDSAPAQHGAGKTAGCSSPGTLPSDQERDQLQARTRHSQCVATPPFPGVPMDLLSRVRGRFPHNASSSLKWEYCVILGLCGNLGNS